ncbi:MAG: hypothetical protein AB7T32_05330 [Dehalococcoidia bacterium]
MAGTRALPLVLGIFAMVLCAGCVKLGESSELPLAAVEPTAVPGDRINCGEILGTAFRSDNERQWFMDNCSKWPLVKVPDEPAPGSSPVVNEPAECAQIRGKPYESNQQRAWYLQNCNQNQPGQPTSNNAQTQSQPQTNTTTGDPDRTDCNAIRGTPYRSNNERAWFQQNCGNSPAPVTTGPDRTDCNQIRGTAYRSPAERDWFNANCRG